MLCCYRPAFFCALRADGESKQINHFLRAFYCENSLRANSFLWKQSVLFLWDIIRAYGAAGAVNENGFVIDLSNVSVKIPHIKHRSLAIVFFVKRHTNELRQIYTSLKGFADQLRGQSRLRCALSQPDSFNATILKSLDQFMILTCPRNKFFKEDIGKAFRGTYFLCIVEVWLQAEQGARDCVVHFNN